MIIAAIPCVQMPAHDWQWTPEKGLLIGTAGLLASSLLNIALVQAESRKENKPRNDPNVIIIVRIQSLCNIESVPFPSSKITTNWEDTLMIILVLPQVILEYAVASINRRRAIEDYQPFASTASRYGISPRLCLREWLIYRRDGMPEEEPCVHCKGRSHAFRNSTPRGLHTADLPR